MNKKIFYGDEYKAVKNRRALIEVSMVIKGVRKLARIERDSEEKLVFWEDFCKNFKLNTHKYKRKFDGLNNPLYLLLISKKKEHIEEAADLHYRLENAENVNLRLGKMYGYPDCCIQHFNDNIDFMVKEKNQELKIRTILKSDKNVFPYFLNNFLLDSFTLHHCCSYSCKETKKRSKKNANTFKKTYPTIFKEISERSKMCLIFNNNINKYLFIENKKFRLKNNLLKIDREITKNNRFFDFENGKNKIDLNNNNFTFYIFK